MSTDTSRMALRRRQPTGADDAANGATGWIRLCSAPYGIVLCLSSALCALIFVEYAYEHRLGAFPVAFVSGLAGSLLFTGFVHQVRKRVSARHALTRAVQVICVVLPFVAVLNVLFDWVTLNTYGDQEVMLGMLWNGKTFVRWCIGTGVLKWIYAAFWQCDVAKMYLPLRLTDPPSCVKICGIAVMAATSVYALRKYPGRLSVALPMLAPMWLFFLAGDTEYFPLVAGFLLIILAELFDGAVRLEDRPFWAVGLLAGAFPLMYIAFAPLSVFVLAFYAKAKPRETWRAVAAAAISFVVLVRVFYAEDLTVFIKEVHMNLRFYDANPDHVFRALYPTSNFLTPVYALSPFHVREVFYMYFFSGGILAPALLAAACWRLRPRTWNVWRALASDPTLGLAILVAVWQVVYLFLYIPRYGRCRDVNLFFPTFIVLAFFAGKLWDCLIDRNEVSEELALPMIALVAGTTGVTAVQLIYSGLPAAV